MGRAKGDSLRFGPLRAGALHLYVDMQALFAGDTDWHTPWMAWVLPDVERLVRRDPARTLFTRFVPPHDALLLHRSRQGSQVGTASTTQVPEAWPGR